MSPLGATHIQRHPSARTLEWVRRATGSESVTVVRFLTGGVSHSNFLVQASSHSRSAQYVLRRWTNPNWLVEDPGFTPSREARVLSLLATLSDTIYPSVIAVDENALETDVPALLETFLAGRPPDVADLSNPILLQQFAQRVREIHAVKIPNDSLVPTYRSYNPELLGIPPRLAEAPDVWHWARQLLADSTQPLGKSLIHRDYHPMNTLWSNSKLSGIVDWTYASTGDGRMDVAHMRWNLAVLHSIESADLFARFYDDLAGTDADIQLYWDLRTVLDLLPEDRQRPLDQATVLSLEAYLQGLRTQR